MPKRDNKRNIYSRSEIKFKKWMKEGRGSGTGKRYKPGLNINEVPSAPKNNRKHSIPGIKAQGRLVQLVSDLELSVFLFFDLAKQVVDIREQYPLDREITLALADKLKVSHPSVVDATHSYKIANWMTTDLLVDYLDQDKNRQQLAVCIKPVKECSNQYLI